MAMLEKTVTIDGIPVKLKASAVLPRLYRKLLGRNLFEDFQILSDSAAQMQDGGTMSGEMVEILENLTYVMAKHADDTVPNDVNEWLEQFTPFAVLTVQNDALELWGNNSKTLSTSKKNLPSQSGK